MSIRQPNPRAGRAARCGQFRTALAAWLEEGSPLPADAEEHCRSCPACARERRLAVRANALLCQLPRLEPSAALARRLHRALVAERTRRGLPDPSLDGLGAGLLRRARRVPTTEAAWPAIAARIGPLAARREARLCRRFGRLVERRLDGELSPGLTRALDNHAARCAACARSLAAARAARCLLRSSRRLELTPARARALGWGIAAPPSPRYGRALPAMLAAAIVVTLVGLAGLSLRDRSAPPEVPTSPAMGHAVALADPAPRPQGVDGEAAAAPIAPSRETPGESVRSGGRTPGTARATGRARARRPAAGPASGSRVVREANVAPDRLESGREGAGGQPVLVVASRGSDTPVAPRGPTGDRAATAIGRVDAQTLTL